MGGAGGCLRSLSTLSRRRDALVPDVRSSRERRVTVMLREGDDVTGALVAMLISTDFMHLIHVLLTGVSCKKNR